MAVAVLAHAPDRARRSDRRNGAVPNVARPRKLPLDVLSVILSALAFSGSSSVSAHRQRPMVTRWSLWVPIDVGVSCCALHLAAAAPAAPRSGPPRPAHLQVAHLHAVDHVLVILMLALFGTIIVLPFCSPVWARDAPSAPMLPGRSRHGSAGAGSGGSSTGSGRGRSSFPAPPHGLALWGMASFGPGTASGSSSRLHVLCLGLGFLFTPAVHHGDRLAAAPPVLVRKRDHRDPAAGGGCRRNRHLRGVLCDRDGCGRQPTRSSRRQPGRRRSAPGVPGGRVHLARGDRGASSCASRITRGERRRARRGGRRPKARARRGVLSLRPAAPALLSAFASAASRTASVRLAAPSLRRIAETCTLTVLRLM